MATVGSLLVDIGMNVARLRSDIDKVRGGFNSMRNDVKRSTDAVVSLKRNIMGLAGTYLTIAGISRAFDLAFSAARFKDMEQGFANLAASHGVNSQKIIANLKELSAGTISTANIMQSAGKAMILGIPADKLGEMMQIARASARVTGQTVQQAFDDIATGIGRQSKLILDNLGIVVDTKKAYDKYAKSLGKTTSELTEMEKKQGFANATMEAGLDIVKRVNVQQKTAAEAMDTFTSALSDVKIFLGKLVISITSMTSSLFLGVGAGINYMIAEIANAMSSLADMASQLPYIGSLFEGLATKLDDIAKKSIKAAKNGIRLSESAFNTAINIWKEVEALEALNQARADSSGEDFEAWAKRMDERYKTELEFEEGLLDAHISYAQKRKNVEANLQQQIMSLRFDAANQAVSLLSIIGQKDKAAALAALALQKALAIAQVFIQTEVAAAAALSLPPFGLGPIAGAPLAAKIKTSGYLSMGLIAATGLAEGIMRGSGSPSGIGGGGGVGALPIEAPEVSGGVQAAPTQGITIIIQNGMGDANYWKRITEQNIIPAIRDAQDRNVNLTVRTV